MEKTSTCPKCNYVNTDEEFSLCPKCGIIIKKYYATLENRQKLEAERLEREKKAEEEAKLKSQQERAMWEQVQQENTRRREQQQREEEGHKQGHIPFNLTSAPLSGRISTWQESHGLLQPVSPIM